MLSTNFKWLVFFILFLAGCREEENSQQLVSAPPPPKAINIVALTQSDQLLFSEAATIEDLPVVFENAFWTADYAGMLYEATATIYTDGSCVILFGPFIKHCPVGGRDRRFVIVARHEIRHCGGAPHSNDPKDLMYPDPPCF